MPIDDAHMARAMDLQKAVRMSLDESHLALAEAYFDLTDEQFHAYPIEGRHNICTIVVHLLQQQDEFNAVLQQQRGIEVAEGWQHFVHQERFGLWGLPPEKLPKPGDEFPSVAQVRERHEALRDSLLANLDTLTTEDLMGPDQHWPHLADRFFRALWHAQCHLRQIWLWRGMMGLGEPIPVQFYA